jgi:AraC-like DNA-binding protein
MIYQAHRVEFYQIILFCEGEGKHHINFKDYHYQQGTIFTIRKDQIHHYVQNEHVAGYLLIFTEEFLTSYFGNDEVLRAFQLFNEFLISPQIDLKGDDYLEIKNSIEKIYQEYHNKEDEFTRNIIRSELHILLLKLFRIKANTSKQLNKRTYFEEFLWFQSLIEQNYTTTRKVLDYAKMMNCTSKTLNNICRAILDKPAKMVIDEIVIMQMKQMLSNTSFPITELAYKLGFDEPTNMFRYFKKHTNHSPEAFRKAYR